MAKRVQKVVEIKGNPVIYTYRKITFDMMLDYIEEYVNDKELVEKFLKSAKENKKEHVKVKKDFIDLFMPELKEEKDLRQERINLLEKKFGIN